MRALLVAIGFLTRIPVPPRVFSDPQAAAASLAWYPAVGVMIGALLWALAWLLRDAPALVSAAVLLVAWIALTGALHLDGLADSADAWIGGMGDRERTLAIMKDPRCGPAGVVALVAVLLLKFAALASLPPQAAGAIVLAPVLARTALTTAFLTTVYARASGLGTALTSTPRTGCTVGVVAALAAAAAAYREAAVIAIAVAALLFLLWRRSCLQRLGGFTGDTAGALAEITEAAVLVAVVVFATR